MCSSEAMAYNLRSRAVNVLMRADDEVQEQVFDEASSDEEDNVEEDDDGDNDDDYAPSDSSGSELNNETENATLAQRLLEVRARQNIPETDRADPRRSQGRG